MDHDAKRITISVIERLDRLHDEWWEKAHGTDQHAYMKAREKLFALYFEYGPQLADLARAALDAKIRG